MCHLWSLLYLQFFFIILTVMLILCPEEFKTKNTLYKSMFTLANFIINNQDYLLIKYRIYL